MNRSIFTGRLTRDPELKHTTAGTPVLSASIAIDDGWGDKKKTYFPDFVFWRHNAEYVGKYARKGDLLEISARYTERKYQDKDGHSRTAKEFEVDEVKILSSRREAAPGHSFETGGFTEDDYTVTDADQGELPF